MNVSFSRVSGQVLQRLRAWQESPGERHRYLLYEEGHRKRAAWSAVLFGGIGSAALPWLATLLKSLSLLTWVLVCLPFAVGLVWGARYLFAFWRAPLKPFVCLTPSHAVRVDVDGVQCVALWRDVESVGMRHRYKDSVYEGCDVQLQTQKGSLRLHLSHDVAENLEPLLQRYGNFVCRWREAKNQDMLNLFDPLQGSLLYGGTSASPRWKRWLPSASLLAASFFAVGGGYLLARQSQKAGHVASIQKCETLDCYIQLLKGDLPSSLHRDVYKAMVNHFHTYKNDARRLQVMMRLTRVPKLRSELSKKLFALFHEEGKKQLQDMVARVRVRYLKQARLASPKAKKAILTLLEAVETQGTQTLSISFERKVKGKGSSRERFDPARQVSIKVEPFYGAFSVGAHGARERDLRWQIIKTFHSIIPSHMLEVKEVLFQKYDRPFSLHIRYTAEVLKKQFFKETWGARYYTGLQYHWEASLWARSRRLWVRTDNTKPTPYLSMFRFPNSARGMSQAEAAQENVRMMYNKMASSAYESFGSMVQFSLGVSKGALLNNPTMSEKSTPQKELERMQRILLKRLQKSLDAASRPSR
ncbi:MAG: hypothetical protein EP343_16160 [Deltaproteobacteria bacterium]|nr:MAG: hypothetical protein EP343_16160 [Deltaproteobacteria bacterium]